jgi:hypothetical protein
MREPTCRVCGAMRPLKWIEIRGSRRGLTRVWDIQTCQDCWRVFETMLDSAAGGYQADLLSAGVQGPVWFW